MQKFKLEDLHIQKADVSSLSGGVCKCCIKVPRTGIAPFGIAAGCNSNVSRNPNQEIGNE